jgi:cyclopropane-fatty-acyl-phospholipid synthase
MKMDKMDLITQPDSSDNSTPKANDARHKSATTHIFQLEKWLSRKILTALGRPHIFVSLPDGTEISVCDKKPETGMYIKDRGALWRFLTNPGLNFGEDFSAGRIQVDGDLVHFLQTIIQTRPKLHDQNRLGRYLLQGFNRRQKNTEGRAQDNIHHHYDIGNDFYKLWLDNELVYTCAYYPDQEATLEQAQFAKMDYVCRKLRLKPGETVVEAGCGWGSLARHMAKYYGVKVKSYNISRQQILEARERCREEGLDGQIEYIEDDYRNIKGTYDVFVSIGMLEHVGTTHYHDLCDTIDKCLAPQGRGLIHSIAQNEAMPMNPWLVKHIFPGGYTPTLREMMETLEPRGFSVLDVENLRLHYAKTLQHWLERFDQHEAEIRDMFDEPFIRAWRLYLAGSIANFSCGDLNLFQVMFTRPANNEIPLTRAYLYSDDEYTQRDGKAWNRATSSS